MFLKENTKNTITIEKSEFICYLARINNLDEYKDFINQVKKHHYDATHCCSAFICKDIKRSSDDGEPSGTAGIPILNVLEKRNMENTAACVVRYFGGIKLGAGGLIRAYSNAVLKTIDNAKLVKQISSKKYKLTISYDIANKVDYFLRNNTNIIDIIYDLEVSYIFHTNNDIDAKLSELTKGIKALYLEDIITEIDIN